MADYWSLWWLQATRCWSSYNHCCPTSECAAVKQLCLALRLMAASTERRHKKIYRLRLLALVKEKPENEMTIGQREEHHHRD